MTPELTDLVIGRLRAQVPALVTIAGAVDFADLVDRGQRPQRLPAAFVLPLGEEATPGELLGTEDWMQERTETIGVVLIHQDRGDATGNAARQKLGSLTAIVRQALAGWQAAGDVGPLHYRRTRLQGLVAGAVWQQLDFEARSELET